MKLSDRLKELRIQKGLLQKDIAVSLGIARTTYNGYETGYREPDIATLVKLSNLYECSIDYLIGLTNFKSEKNDNEEYVVAVEYMKEKNINIKDLKALISLIRSLDK